MAVIYLRHEKHGAKVACSDMEAKYDEGHGWKRYDPADLVPIGNERPFLTISKLPPVDYSEDARKMHAFFEAKRAEMDPLDHDGDGKKGGSISGGSGEDINYLRSAYVEKFGKKPFPGWNADILRAKMAA